MDQDGIFDLLHFDVLLWITVFILVRFIFIDRSFDFCNRSVSTIHATIAVTMASLSVQDWSCPVCPLASTCSPKQMKTLRITVGYFIYDLVCSLYYKNVKLDNVIHHIVSIIGLGAGLFFQRSCSELVAALWITELSSPFLHLRELLKEIGYKDTAFNLAVDIVFAVVFTSARMICGPYLTYLTLYANNPFLVKATALGLQLVSAFWFFKIVRMVMNKLSKWKSSKRITSPESQLNQPRSGKDR